MRGRETEFERLRDALQGGAEKVALLESKIEELKIEIEEGVPASPEKIKEEIV
jgi:hypothetical protein